MTDLQRAFDRIIEPLRARMIQSIWRIVGNPQDAEDVLQTALLRLWRNWTRVTAHPCPDALVLKICIDATYDAIRRRRRGQRSEQPMSADEEPVDSLGSPPDMLIQNETYAAVLNAIRGLSRQQATATLLRVVEELPYNQIAIVMKCSEATARKHVARGREHLRTALAHLLSNHSTRS